MGWSYEFLVAEEVSAVSAATEMARLASAALYTLSSFGTKAQKGEFLAPVLAGEKVGALALTMPEAGSNASSIETQARTASDEFVLNGDKRFITNGGVAHFLLVFAVTHRKQDTRRGISAIVVPNHPESESSDIIGFLECTVQRWCISDFGTLVCPGATSSGLNQGFSVLLDELDKERPAVAAGMTVIARSAIEAAVMYSAARRQFGKLIRSFEGVSFKVADMATRLEASRLLTLKAARLLDSGRDCRKVLWRSYLPRKPLL